MCERCPGLFFGTCTSDRQSLTHRSTVALWKSTQCLVHKSIIWASQPVHVCFQVWCTKHTSWICYLTRSPPFTSCLYDMAIGVYVYLVHFDIVKCQRAISWFAFLLWNAARTAQDFLVSIQRLFASLRHLGWPELCVWSRASWSCRCIGPSYSFTWCVCVPARSQLMHVSLSHSCTPRVAVCVSKCSAICPSQKYYFFFLALSEGTWICPHLLASITLAKLGPKSVLIVFVACLWHVCSHEPDLYTK